MNDTVILDSNAIIALLDGNKAVARMLENVQQVLVPAIVCGEIDAGAQGANEPRAKPLPRFWRWNRLQYCPSCARQGNSTPEYSLF